MYVSRTSDAGATFTPAQKLGAGTWPLNSCPMDGGGLVMADSGAVTTIWRREKTMFRCRAGAPEETLGNGEQGQIAASGSREWLTWLQGRPGLLKVRDSYSTAQTIAENADDPALVALPNGQGAIVFWNGGNRRPVGIRCALLR